MSLSEKSQFILMAEYNQLMNQRILDASGNLSNSSLSEDKGAFFKSIIMTLNHIMIGDILWLTRFMKHPSDYTALKQLNEFPQAQKLDQILFDDIVLFYKERKRLDGIIIEFCNMINKLKSVGIVFLLSLSLFGGTLVYTNGLPLTEELHDVLIIGSAEYPDPVLERVWVLEKKGVLRNVIVMESFPVQIRVTGPKINIEEIQKMPRKISPNFK